MKLGNHSRRKTGKSHKYVKIKEHSPEQLMGQRIN